MNKQNFNSIDKIKTPDNWKEKALNIPCTHLVKPVSNRHNIYKFATAFCLTVLCLVCCAIFFIMDNNTLMINPDSNQSVETNGTCTNTTYTNTQASSQTRPDVTPTGALVTNPTSAKSPEPTEKPSQLPSDAPTENPTQAPTNQPPTQMPTEIPSDTPTQMPTTPPFVTTSVIFNGSVNSGWTSVASVDVYCKVYDSNGVLLGSNDLFDAQHEANYLGEINNVDYYSYNASDKGLKFTQGYYSFVFYGSNGNFICSGQKYIS